MRAIRPREEILNQIGHAYPVSDTKIALPDGGLQGQAVKTGLVLTLRGAASHIATRHLILKLALTEEA